jgi:thioredoxin reductase (NADPH)
MPNAIIIGNGPAGIAAALYILRAGFEVTIIGKDGGSLLRAGDVANYYGFEDPIPGNELIARGISQAQKHGATILNDEVIAISYVDKLQIKTKSQKYSADCVILATGSSRATPRISGIHQFDGKGVSYCAMCDSFFYKGKDVAVLGSGEYAVHEALHLKLTSKSVTILTNGDNLDAVVSEDIKMVNKEIESFNGDTSLEKVIFKDGSSLDVSGIFIAIGVAGSTEIAKMIGAATDGSKVVVNDNMETTIPGLFAAGDCVGGLLQISKAVCDGAKSGIAAIQYLKNISK